MQLVTHPKALFATESKPCAASPQAPAPIQNDQRLIESEQRHLMQLMLNHDKEIEAIASIVVNLKEIAVVMGN